MREASLFAGWFLIWEERKKLMIFNESALDFGLALRLLVISVEMEKEIKGKWNFSLHFFGTLRIRWCTLSCGKKDREENSFSSLSKHSKREREMKIQKTTRWSFFLLVCGLWKNSCPLETRTTLKWNEWLSVECGKPHGVLTLLSAVGSPNNTSSPFFIQTPRSVTYDGADGSLFSPQTTRAAKTFNTFLFRWWWYCVS